MTRGSPYAQNGPSNPRGLEIRPRHVQAKGPAADVVVHFHQDPIHAGLEVDRHLILACFESAADFVGVNELAIEPDLDAVIAAATEQGLTSVNAFNLDIAIGNGPFDVGQLSPEI